MQAKSGILAASALLLVVPWPDGAERQVTRATLATIAEEVGYLPVGRYEIDVADHYRSQLKETWDRLVALEPTIPRVATPLQERYWRMRAWLAGERGAYDEAARAFRLVGDRERGADAQRRHAFVRAADGKLSPGLKIVVAAPLRGNFWAAAVAGEGEQGCLIDPALWLVRFEGKVWERLDRVSLDNRWLAGMRHVQVIADDLGVDSQSEVTVVAHFWGGSWQPTWVTRYAARKRHWERTFRAFSEHSAEIRDIDHDGCFEIITLRCIGRSLSHIQQPRWSDIYAVRHGRYALANERFPSWFERYRAPLRGLAAANPKDDEIARYQALVEKMHQRNAGKSRQERDARRTK